MDFIDLLFKLIKKFVPLTQEQYIQLLTEAENWRNRIKPDSTNPLERFYFNIHKSWGIRLAFAIAYIPLVKYIMDIMRPSIDTVEN